LRTHHNRRNLTARDVAILSCLRTQKDPSLAWPSCRRPPCCPSFAEKELTERCTMALALVYREPLTEFPPRPGTLTARPCSLAGKVVAEAARRRQHRRSSAMA